MHPKGARIPPARCPALTAIVPTRDRRELLDDCLRTLAAQILPSGVQLEVLVVDDGSAPALSETLRWPASDHVKFRVLRQEGRGANHARNAGVADCASPLVAFLDDDTLLPPDWAREMLAAGALGPDGIAGRIQLRLEGQRPRWLTEAAPGYLSAYDEGDAPKWAPGIPLPVSANCAVTRAAFDRVGGFDGGIDRVGGSLLSGGETEFYRRILASGGRILYWPGAVVEHRVAAQRLTLDYFRRRGYAQGLTDGLIEPPMSRVERRREWGRLAMWTLRIPLVAGKGLLLNRSLATARIWISYCRGRRDYLRGVTHDVA